MQASDKRMQHMGPISSEWPSDWVYMMLAADNVMFDDGLDKKNTYYATMQNNSF